ncbi:MAG TPA: PLP-dependent aminotransferase family protein [Geothrix sp.]|nr:PLP-dependent aminotransferase family protein [Geothrix sp.]
MTPRTGDPLYLALASDLRSAMEEGRLAPGARLPSIRESARLRRLSVNTVLAAYRLLETRGLVEARPHSGYFVKAQLPRTQGKPLGQARRAREPELAVLDQITAVIAAQALPGNVDLSLACPRLGPWYPGAKLGRITSRLLQQRPELITTYSLPPGPPLLRHQVARHAQALGMKLEPDRVVLTNGCLEALQIALRGVTRPGDAVGIESPTYFSLLPLLADLGLKARELPTHPETGLVLDKFEALLCEKRLAAAIVMPNLHNPMGTVMPLTAKKRLAALVNAHQVPLIEDSIYAELQFRTPLEPAVRAFDADGWVIVCSSFSKTLAPGFRLGWLEGGRFHRELAQIKFASSVAQPALLAEAVGVFMESGGYEAHLRHLRRAYAIQMDRLRGLVSDHFPAGTRATSPAGGYLLWVELPEGCSAQQLFQRALAERITVTPGNLFSPSGHYDRYLRLSACYPLEGPFTQALSVLGRLAGEQLAGAR